MFILRPRVTVLFIVAAVTVLGAWIEAPANPILAAEANGSGGQNTPPVAVEPPKAVKADVPAGAVEILNMESQLRWDVTHNRVPAVPADILEAIVPRGVKHPPVAADQAHVLFLAPASTANTGSIRDERTVDPLERL